MWTVNGVNPNTYGLKVAGVPGWETAPALDYISQQVPGRAGNLLLRPTPQIGSRRLSAEAMVVGTSNADLLTKLDALKALFSAPSLVVVMDNRPARQITCRLDGGFAVTPGEVSMITRKLPVSFTLVADDPWWYDTTLTTVAGIALIPANTAMPQGTAPVSPVVTATCTANVALLDLALYNSAGALLAELLLSRAFVIGDVVVIDMANKTVKVNGINSLVSIFSGDFFQLDVSAQGDFLTSAWPKIGRSASFTVDVSYRKAWR